MSDTLLQQLPIFDILQSSTAVTNTCICSRQALQPWCGSLAVMATHVCVVVEDSKQVIIDHHVRFVPAAGVCRQLQHTQQNTE